MDESLYEISTKLRFVNYKRDALKINLFEFKFF